MTYVMLVTLVVIAIFWSGWAAHRLWIGPAVRRYRYRRAMNRLGIGAFVVCRA